jgi:hypothetical protein
MGRESRLIRWLTTAVFKDEERASERARETDRVIAKERLPPSLYFIVRLESRFSASPPLTHEVGTSSANARV